MSTRQQPRIYQLKVALQGSRPPIWRRILVAGSTELGTLHIILQIVMGWTNSHLHQFVCKDKYYGVVDDEFGLDFGPEMLDENSFVISRLLTREKDSLIYEYDFGDGWEHKIVVEKITPHDSDSGRLPRCIRGKRACPPEDCGGIWGYRQLIEIAGDPAHPEHEETLEWLGDDFDPEYFDIAEVNETLDEYLG